MSFAAWIGRETCATDRLDEGLAARWLATFDLPHLHPPTIPQGIHFALCTPEAPTAKLGEDGHPTRDDSPDSFLPPFPMPRRMWASSRIAFHAPVAIGAAIERVSRIAAISEKQGSTGPLAFVDVSHETFADGALAVVETQSIVYREAASAGQDLSPPPLGEASFNPAGWEASRTLVPDDAPPVPLFGADLQRAPHPLRPPLCHGGGRLPGADRARPADRHLAARRPA